MFSLIWKIGFAEVSFNGIYDFRYYGCPADQTKKRCEQIKNYIGKEKLIFPKFSGDVESYKAMLTEKIDGKVSKGKITDLIVVVKDNTKIIIEGIIKYPEEELRKILIFTKDNWNSVEAVFFENPEKKKKTFRRRFKPEEYIKPYGHWYSSDLKGDISSVKNFVQAFQIDPKNIYTLTKRGWGQREKFHTKQQIDLFLTKNISDRKGMHLKKISVDYSSIEAAKILTEDGYKCGGDGCMKENATINFTGNTEAISFNCHNFNVCTYSLREVADLLVQNKIIDKLNYTTKTFKDYKVWRTIEKYSGRGSDGDEIIICKGCDPFNINTILITLTKGNLGKKVAFN